MLRGRDLKKDTSPDQRYPIQVPGLSLFPRPAVTWNSFHVGTVTDGGTRAGTEGVKPVLGPEDRGSYSTPKVHLRESTLFVSDLEPILITTTFSSFFKCCQYLNQIFRFDRYRFCVLLPGCTVYSWEPLTTK